MERSSQYFVFGLEDQRYALALAAVLRVIRAVELTYLPNAPDNLVGLLNMGGETLLNWGMTPTIVKGEDALRALEDAESSHNPFPLVLLDAAASEKGGFAIGAEMSANPKWAVPIIRYPYE